jgi:hypothetical protein
MAAPAATIAALSAGLRRRYSDKFVSAIEWSSGPLAAMIKKVGWTGFPTWAMRVGNSPARSATFATAQTLAASEMTRIVQPVIPTYQQDYGLATIEGRLMKAAGNKEGALYDKMVAQIDGIMKGTMASFSAKIYRAGWGKLSTIKSTTTLASTTLVLENPEDAVLFEIGMSLQFSESESGHVFRGSPTGEALRVEGIDFVAGTLTTSANVSTIDNVALGDTIFASGDRQDSATPSRLCITGMEGQLNASDALFGVTRSGDGRLRGVSFSAAGMSAEAAIIRGLTETTRYGGKVDKIFMNPSGIESLIRIAQGRFRPVKVNGPAGIGVDGISVVTATGREVEVFGDMYCPVNRIFGLEMDSFQVFCAESAKIPAFLDDDGNTMLRLASADGVEARVGYYAEVGCNAPCHNFVATSFTP